MEADCCLIGANHTAKAVGAVGRASRSFEDIHDHAHDHADCNCSAPCPIQQQLRAPITYTLWLSLWLHHTGNSPATLKHTQLQKTDEREANMGGGKAMKKQMSGRRDCSWHSYVARLPGRKGCVCRCICVWWAIPSKRGRGSVQRRHNTRAGAGRVGGCLRERGGEEE